MCILFPPPCHCLFILFQSYLTLFSCTSSILCRQSGYFWVCWAAWVLCSFGNLLVGSCVPFFLLVKSHKAAIYDQLLHFGGNSGSSGSVRFLSGIFVLVFIWLAGNFMMFHHTCTGCEMFCFGSIVYFKLTFLFGSIVYFKSTFLFGSVVYFKLTFLSYYDCLAFLIKQKISSWMILQRN